MPYEVGKTLKKYRTEANMTVRQISDVLIQKGFKASEKTIYSWESGNSQPTPDALLIMCDAYGIKDVLSAFGYDRYDDDGRLILNMHEIEMVEKYRALDEHGKELIDSILDKEYQRCLLPLSGQPTIFDIISPEDLAELEKAAQHSDMHFSDDFDKFIKSFSSIFPFSEENEFKFDATHDDHLDESGEPEIENPPSEF